MADPSRTKIIVFVGLIGSGKTTALTTCAAHQLPSITGVSVTEAIDEISRLVQAGQHVIATDCATTIDELMQLRRAFPGTVTVVAILAARHYRLQRTSLPGDELDAHDRHAVEQRSLGAVIALADHFLPNNRGLAHFTDMTARAIDLIQNSK